MPQRQLDHLLDLRELLPGAADVVVADGVERVLLLLALDGLALAVDHRVRRDDAELSRVGLDNLERSEKSSKTPGQEVEPAKARARRPGPEVKFLLNKRKARAHSTQF